MRTESETRDLIKEHIELWFKRVQGVHLWALIYHNPEEHCYFLHIVNPKGYTDADDAVFGTMENFYKLVPKSAFSKEYPSPFAVPSETEERLIFIFKYQGHQ